jgi:Recombinase
MNTRSDVSASASSIPRAGGEEPGVAGHLIKSLKRVLAHDYALKLSQVVQRGRRAHAERGHWTGGRPPYGYRRAVTGPDGRKRVLADGEWKARGQRVVLVVDAMEADVVVSRIFGPYVRGQGLATIAAALNEAAIRPPDSNRRRGSVAWTKSSVWSILRNAAYVGTATYGKARYSERRWCCRPPRRPARGYAKAHRPPRRGGLRRRG